MKLSRPLHGGDTHISPDGESHSCEAQTVHRCCSSCSESRPGAVVDLRTGSSCSLKPIRGGYTTRCPASIRHSLDTIALHELLSVTTTAPVTPSSPQSSEAKNCNTTQTRRFSHNRATVRLRRRQFALSHRWSRSNTLSVAWFQPTDRPLGH